MNSLIETAFETLRNNGFFAEQNWKCCQSCGAAALPDDTEKYVFYHAQDEEELIAHGACYLAFGETEAEGVQIVKALKEAGLRVEWNGSIGTRIYVIDPNREM